MANLAPVYSKALQEFESLTNKKAATSKNKGKEEGVKKLLVLFKSGKTLDQRFTDFDNAVNESERGGGKSDPKKLMAAVLTAFQKLDEGLKKNISEYTSQGKSLGPDEKDLKTGNEVFVNRMEALRKQAKGTAEARQRALTAAMGQSSGPDDKLKTEIRTVYLNMAKGVAETQALMKSFIAKPSEDKIEATFSSPSGPRSIGAAVTHWKTQVLKQKPDLANQLGADPEHLIKLIFDMTQRKGLAFWKSQFGHPNPGWENKAKATAQKCLDQMNNWAIMANKIKASGG